MMIAFLSQLALAVALSATPTPPRPTLAADSMPLLTVDALTRMTTLWVTFLQEPPAIRDTARAQMQEIVTLTVDSAGQPQTQTQQLVNMAAMAKKYPSVAADFKKAGLTPKQWEDFRRSMLSAVLTRMMRQQLGTPALPNSSSIVEKNASFLDTHLQEINDLSAAGMWIGYD